MADESNPWVTKSRAIRYENPWIRVEHHEVKTPSGSDGIYGVVRFKNLAVGVVPLDDDDHIWVVGQYRYPLDRYSWEIPEGGGGPDESPLEAARRELREELGIEAGRWDEILQLDLSNSVSDESGVIFLARDLRLHEAEPEETERLTARRVPLATFHDEILRGLHRDSLTVAGVLRVRCMQLEGTLGSRLRR